jgi:hypothetical protein
MTSSAKFPRKRFNLSRATWSTVKYHDIKGSIAVLADVLPGLSHSTRIIARA